MPAKTTFNFMEGEVLLIDKPYEWTSFDVVNKIRYTLKRKLDIKKIKVGHAGTLDPLATGLLIICTGKFTKKIESYQNQDKEYTGTLYLGATTPSFDRETKINKEFETNQINEEMMMQATRGFIGKTSQTPPIFSALKVDGEALYKKARKGIKVEIKSREVQVNSFELLKIRMPYVYFKISCSKGTYIRSLVDDFGRALNSGAYLYDLKRTSIGDYRLEDAWSLEEFIKFLDIEEQMKMTGDQ